MPKKVLEIQKKEMVEDFVNGFSIEELSKKFNCTKVTITRHLKKGVNKETYKNLLKKTHKITTKSHLEKNLISEDYSNIEISDEDKPLEFLEASSFTEIVPLNLDIDNEPQKDLSSISITEVDLPKIVYLIVDNKIELQTKLLKNYPDWQFLSQNELNRSTIEIFFDIKQKYEEWNFWVIFISGFTPIPFKVFTVSAGAFNINFTLFLIASLVARSARFLIIGSLIWKFGKPIRSFIDKYFNILAFLFSFLLINFKNITHLQIFQL